MLWAMHLNKFLSLFFDVFNWFSRGWWGLPSHGVMCARLCKACSVGSQCTSVATVVGDDEWGF